MSTDEKIILEDYTYRRNLTDIEIEGVKSIIKDKLYNMDLAVSENSDSLYRIEIYPEQTTYYNGEEIITFKVTTNDKIVMSTVVEKDGRHNYHHYVIYNPKDKEEINIKDLTYEYEEYRDRFDKTLDLTRNIFRNICKDLDFKKVEEIGSVSYYKDTNTGSYGMLDERESTNERLILNNREESRYIKIVGDKPEVNILLSGSEYRSPTKRLNVPIVNSQDNINKDTKAEIKELCIKAIKITINYIVNGVLSENLPE